jgi:hypothetical protein
MKDETSVDAWTYRGVRALVILHDRELRRFLDTWRIAKAKNVSLAGTLYPADTSLEDILVHVLHWARDYVIWCCEKLELPDPGCDPVPTAGAASEKADAYASHLLTRWQKPFRALPDEVFYEPQYRTRWGSTLPVEALLEHAVVHPMRHRLQLEELIGGEVPNAR